ncbi:MAG TPA: LCP family protein [Acidimicrobiales bacterium]|nr:LCP family protein [Acidimicrobiales bacterium]
MADDDRRRDLDRVPDLADAPIDWDTGARRFRGDAAPAGRDTRRLVVPAPPEGGRATPPPRRRPEVVLPTAAPGPAPGIASPPARQARVVVPAPGAAAAGKAGARPAVEAERRAPTPAAEPSSTRRWPPSRRTVVRALAGLVVVLLLAGLGGLLWGYQQFRSIEKVELADVLASGDGTNYLIVGSDTREGVSPDDPNAGAILGPDAPTGSERSDTILILRIDGEGARMLSVPRDLLVTIAETGSVSRINAAFNGGPRRLIATLTDQLGLPIHHYLEIDFVAFRDLVDALGGIVIDFPHPASDHMSGLNVPEAGQVRLDGTQALAYVRSRYYTETIDGRQVTEPTGDIGRVVRQQKFLSAVVAEVGSLRNPLRVASVTQSMVDGMRVDDGLGYFDAIRLVLRFRSLELEPTSLPTSNRTLSSGAQVLDLVQPDADEVLARFGSAGATTG